MQVKARVTVETLCSAKEISENILDFVPTAYIKTCVKRPLYKIPKLAFKTNYRLMLQGEHSAILLTIIQLPFVIKIFVLSIIEWRFYTGFTDICD